MKNGIELIANERQEQIEKHNYNKEHDAEHWSFELSRAALCYLRQATYMDMCMWQDRVPNEWPFESKYWKPRPQIEGSICPKIKKEDAIKMLTIAGAFISAEIDRLLNTPEI
jgi:hypothetical protein